MNLTSPQDLKSFLGKFGVVADKSLGQHFLCSPNVVQRIVEEVGFAEGILEIGPGPGVLTSLLATQQGRVHAIEIDASMMRLLSESSPFAKIISADALKIDLADAFVGLQSPRAVVGNLPYYITAALLTRIAGVRQAFDKAVLMMQKEVAERVCALPGNSSRGSLSVFLQARFEISVVCQVPPSSFMPPPKVDSTVLRFVTRQETLLPQQRTAFDRVVRVAFMQPRKTLLNNLTSGLSWSREKAESAISSAGLVPNVRAHMVTMDEWNLLARAAE